MDENKLLDYYNRFKNLRVAKKYVEDIKFLETNINNKNYSVVVNNLSNMILKYYKEFVEITRLIPAITIKTTDGEVIKMYSSANKNWEDLENDTNNCINYIIIIASVNLGFQENIKGCIDYLNN